MVALHARGYLIVLYQSPNVSKSAEELTEEEALARFECTARDLLKLSASGFLAKYKRGEFGLLDSDPKVMEVVKVIPESLSLNR